MRPFRSAPALLALTAAVSLVLSGCGSSDADAGSAQEPAAGGASSAAEGAFPVTIEHAFGETTIDAEPERVVTWGFSSADAALALGVVPVAIPQETYGGDADGVLPWIADELDELGAETPTMLTNANATTIPFEEIVAADPDVILATYSGITEEEYETLSAIAPVVAYPDAAWSTPWRDVVTTVGEALGKPEEAEQAIADTEKTIADAAAAHPELEGKTVAAAADFSGTFYVYTGADPRVEYLTDLGMVVAPSVTELDTGESSFYFTLSQENLGQLQSDVLVTYSDTQEAADAFLAAPSTQLLPQVAEGHVASVVGTSLVSSVSPPTVLSLTWGLDPFLEALSAAAS